MSNKGRKEKVALTIRVPAEVEGRMRRLVSRDHATTNAWVLDAILTKIRTAEGQK